MGILVLAGALLAVMCGAQAADDDWAEGIEVVDGKPQTSWVPDPDKVEWEGRQNRPGYRYRGMTSQQENFYNYIVAKRDRGEELLWAERLMIRDMQRNRRWPEAPVPNEVSRQYMRYLRNLDREELTWAERMMVARLFSLGLVSADRLPGATTEKMIERMQAGPREPRNWFERWFGRVDDWMWDDMVQSGYDMRGKTGLSGPVFPDEHFNGMQFSYNVSGANLTSQEDRPGFTTSRSCKGEITGDKLTVSGTASMSRGYGAVLTVRAWGGQEHEEIKKDLSRAHTDGTVTRSFSVSIPLPADVMSAGFSIRMDGSYSMGGGHRGLVMSASLERDAAARRAAADAAWKNEVERTLAELGYEDTQAGKQIKEMRAALEGSDADWQRYVDRNLQSLGYDPTPQGKQYRELAEAVEEGGDKWDTYVKRQSAGPPPGEDEPFQLKVGTGTSGGSVEGAGTHFDKASKLACAFEYADVPADTQATAVWYRNGQEFSRGERTIGGTGWASFNVFTSDPGGLRAGKYELYVYLGRVLLGRSLVTVGGAG